MRYLQVTGQHVANVIHAEPTPLPDGYVRVAVAYAGVCHSDLAKVADGGGEFPYRLGHEVSGVVTEAAAGTLPSGTRVVAYVEDGFASEVVVPVGSTVALHPDCSLLDGALAEPVGCVIGGLERLSFREHAQVVLVGAGFMGLLALRYLTLVGHRVYVIEPRAVAQKLASSWGAETVIHPDEVPGEMSREQPVVIESTGVADGLQLAGDLVAIDGTLGVLGYHQSGGGQRSVNMKGWNYRAMSIVNLHNRIPGNMLTWIERAQRCAARGFISPSQLVDSEVNLEELADVLAGQPGPDAFKTVLRPATESPRRT